MEGETLKERLRARRRAMNVSLQSEAPTEIPKKNTVTTIAEVHDLTGGTEVLEALDEDEENVLRSALELRREKSRRKLEKAEREQLENQTLFESTLEEPLTDVLSSPRTPSPSHGLSSPRFDSQSSTPLGRSGQHGTLRNRLQAKMLAAKRVASPAGDSKRSRLRDRMNFSSRFDETYKQYTAMEEEQLVQKIKSKLKWKQAMDVAKSQSGVPTEADCYDFFTKQYEDVEVPPEETPSAPVQEGEQREEPMEESTGVEEVERRDGQEQAPPVQEAPEDEQIDESEQKRLIGDIITKDLEWKLYDINAASYGGYHNQVEKERLTYFVPSMLPADIRSKVQDNNYPRYLEDEGFYVGEKPLVLRKNINILENRILRQPDHGHVWFSANGEVESLPDPIKSFVAKPWIESIEELDPSLCTVYVKAYEQAVEEKYFKGSEENELQIDIGTVVFNHHPLMSREHVLSSNISQMYDEYLQTRHKNYINFYTDKLTALRNAVVTLKDSSDSFSEQAELAAHETRISDYMAEIRRTSRQLNAAESSERELMRKIIEEWKEVKSLREFQGFTNTTTKLIIKKEEVNQQQDQARWEKEVKSEVEEIREEYEVTVMSPYQERHRKYQAQLQEWKKNRLKIKRQRLKNQRSSKENLFDPTEGDNDDEEIMIAGNIDKPEKPDKPQAFDEEVTRVQVMNELLEYRRNPGENRISLQLTNTANVTPISGVPIGESARRKAVQKSLTLLKVLFNGKEVFQTEAKTLTTDFKLNFGSIFRVRIAQWPESLKVQVLESGLVRNTMISEMFLTIPDFTVHAGNVQLGMVPFVSEHSATYEHEAVGSNAPFNLRQGDSIPSSISTKGQLIGSVSWGLDNEGNVLAPEGLANADPLDVLAPLKSIDPVSAIGADGIQDPESLSKWVQDSRLDPNDPDNAALVPFMENKQDGHGFLYAPDYFRLEQLQEEFNFLVDEEFDRMNRLRLLQLRDQEVNEFRNMTMIPSQESEVTDSAFTTYERRIKEKDSLQVVGERQVRGGTLSAHRLEVLRFRQRVKDAVLHRFYTSRHHYTLQDIVHEEQVPDITTLGADLSRIVEPRRPLKPIRKERKKATTHTLSEGSVNILVNVIRGYNVPTRQTNHAIGGTMTGQAGTATLFPGTSRSEPQLPGLDYDSKSFLVTPFVAISFQDNVVCSSVAKGPSPCWNEELQVPFSAPNSDYSPSSLQTVDDIIYVHLFDRIIEEAPQQRGQEDSSLITHRVQNYWLGSFKLPFSTVYQRGKIEGSFKIKIPPVLLGYDIERQAIANEYREQFETLITQPGSGTYLTLFVTLEPILKPMEAPRQKFESQEDETTLIMCATYLMECNKKFPNRNVKATVIDIKGESVLISRYIHPLQPPTELTEGSDPLSLSTAERVARFVSLIPFVSDNVVYAGICDLWSTCDQFMQMLCGDEEEHAILLVNYFLYLGKRAYLLLGNAVPEGSTAYVLTIEDTTREYYVWNASTGRYYHHNDNLCPLQSVGSVVNNENIWFNMQVHDLPSKVRYDLLRPSDWKPFYTTKFPLPAVFPTVQPESLYYTPTDRSYINSLTDTVERTLKDKIMSWRPRNVTRWNRTCNALLHQILKSLEQNMFKRGPVAEVNHGEQLLRQLGDVRFTGFPMDLPFTDIESIVSAVRSTEVHKIQDADVEFSLAVYIHPYPASVLAVWIYVAAVVNKRRHNL